MELSDKQFFHLANRVIDSFEESEIPKDLHGPVLMMATVMQAKKDKMCFGQVSESLYILWDAVEDEGEFD